MNVVVPPKAAARPPDLADWARIAGLSAMLKWTWASMPPGTTYLARASMIRWAGRSIEFGAAKATMRPSMMPTSNCSDECGDTTVPPAGTPRLYTDLHFRHADGRAVLHPVTPVPISDAPRPGFPLLLNTGRTVEHWHTRTKTGRVPILEGLAPEAWIEVHPDDATSRGLSSGDWARVWSRRGSIDRIRVRVTRIVRAGEVFVPFHWDDRCANLLTRDEFDPISREPNYKQCAVEVTRA